MLILFSPTYTDRTLLFIQFLSKSRHCWIYFTLLLFNLFSFLLIANFRTCSVECSRHCSHMGMPSLHVSQCCGQGWVRDLWVAEMSTDRRCDICCNLSVILRWCCILGCVGLGVFLATRVSSGLGGCVVRYRFKSGFFLFNCNFWATLWIEKMNMKTGREIQQWWPGFVRIFFGKKFRLDFQEFFLRYQKFICRS